MAERLCEWGKADSVERRLQRWLSNPRLDMTVCMQQWVKWVWGSLEGVEPILLVDETKLSDHLGVMRVGCAYEGRCIPLAWQVYLANDKAGYPAAGQVGIIMGLLLLIQACLPAHTTALVQADRGIGNSSALMTQIRRMGWWYLLRVKDRTLYRRSRPDKAVKLRQLVKPGERWSALGWTFKDAHRLRHYLHVIWNEDQQAPWCLVTNDPTIQGGAYALRMWQEQGFRDLKSGG